MSDLCQIDLPGPGELARLAENAQAGRREAFVGTGHPDTMLACPHGTWRLGDILGAYEADQDDDEPAVCAGVKRDGKPCSKQAKPGSRFCAAHQDQGAAE